MIRCSIVLAAFLLTTSCSRDELNRDQLNDALASAQSKKPVQGGTSVTVPYADLGPHVAELSLNFFVRTAAGFRHRVVLERRIFRGSDGAYRILDDRSWTDPDASPRGADDGRELLFTGERFVARRKWGPWKERPFWSGQHLHELRQAYDLVPTVLGMFQAHLSRVPDVAETIMQKEAKWESFSLNTTPQLPSEGMVNGNDRFHETRIDEWFQSTHRPEVVTGRMARRVDNGEIMRADLTIQGRATVKREDADFEMSASFNLMPIGQDRSFALPQKVVPAERQRTWKMIDDVLGNSLREVYRRHAATGKARSK